MFYRQPATRTSAPPPRVLFHDFNDDTREGIIAYQKPDLGERVILADVESIRVWAVVTGVSEWKKANGSCWLVQVDVESDTMRNA